MKNTQKNDHDNHTPLLATDFIENLTKYQALF